MDMFETVDPREAFQKVGEAMDMDAELGTFGMAGTESVSWLMKEPTNMEETLINAYERLRSLGITVTMEANKAEVSASDHLKALEVRLRASVKTTM